MSKPQMDLFTFSTAQTRPQSTVTPQPVAGHDHPQSAQQSTAAGGPSESDTTPVARTGDEPRPEEDVHNPFAGGGGFDLSLPTSPLQSHDPFAEWNKARATQDEAQVPHDVFGGPEPEDF